MEPEHPLRIFEWAVGELTAGRDVVSALVVSRKGSAPRRPGARMFISADGSIRGTVGGGRVEAEVLAAAQELFREKKNRTLSFRLYGEDAAEADLICGGELGVHLEFFSAAESS